VSRKEFRINEHLVLKLINKRTHIFVNGVEFNQCKYLLFNLDKNHVEKYDDIKSIDDAVEQLDRSHEQGGNRLISAETEFWGHCSNLQAWHDNYYDTRLLHSNLAFPLLKKLVEAGDPRARKAFKDEIAYRFENGTFQIKALLVVESYLDILTKEELETFFLANNEQLRTQVIALLEDNNQSIKKRHVMNFLIYLMRRGDIEAKRIFTRDIMNHLTFNKDHENNSLHSVLSEGYAEFLDKNDRKELLIRTLKEGTFATMDYILGYTAFKNIAINDESLFSSSSHFFQIMENRLFQGGTAPPVFSILRKLHKGGSKPAKKLTEHFFVQFFEKVNVAPPCFYENAFNALECFDKEERIELAQKVSPTILAFLIVHYETLKNIPWLHFNEGKYTILINGAIGVMDRVNDDFNPDDYQIIKLKKRKYFKKIKIDNRVKFDFHLIRRNKTERYFLTNVNFRIAFSLLNKDSEGILCIPKDPTRDSRFRMTSHEENIVLYIAPNVLDLAGLIESTIRIKERMINRMEKRRYVLFSSLLTHYLKHKKERECEKCIWRPLYGDDKHPCDFLNKKRSLSSILDDFQRSCMYKEEIKKLSDLVLKNRLTLSRTHNTFFKRQLKLVELKEAFYGKKTVNLTIKDKEDTTKIRTNSIKNAIMEGRSFDDTPKKITEKAIEKKVKQESKKARIKQTSLADFMSSDKNTKKDRKILISSKKNQSTDKKEEDD